MNCVRVSDEQEGRQGGREPSSSIIAEDRASLFKLFEGQVRVCRYVGM